MKIENRKCESCDYWEQNDVYQDGEYDYEYDCEIPYRHGECHRHAPRPVATEELKDDIIWEKHYNQMQDTMWPQTKSYCWCGEFKEA